MTRSAWLVLCCLLAAPSCVCAPRAGSKAPGSPLDPRVTWVALADGGVIKLVGPTTITFDTGVPPRRGNIYVAGTEGAAALSQEAEGVMAWYRPFAEKDGDSWIGLQAIVRGGIKVDEPNESYRFPFERDPAGEWHHPAAEPQHATSGEKLPPAPVPDEARDVLAEQQAAAAARESLDRVDAGAVTRALHSIRVVTG